MANQISMSQKQSIAALHALGMSNRQIAALLNLQWDTVNRHFLLLKIQNRPEAPPGDFAGIPLADAAQPECADRFGVDGSGSIAECSCSRLGTSSSGAKADGPTSDVIWEEAELVVPGGR
jgi:hypothetical protein